MSESEITIVEALENIALTDPISAVLFLVGGLITGASMLILGGLSFGSAVEFLTER
jgi:NADH:ubiquinone oxidoreductase subunit 6 (subunit J)